MDTDPAALPRRDTTVSGTGPGAVPARVNILGVGVHATSPGQAAAIITAAARSGDQGYVCVTGVHGVMESQRDDRLRAIHNASLLTVPDGMPLTWVGRLRGYSGMRRTYGPDLMLDVCAATASAGIRHFLYGGHPGVVEDLAEELRSRFPGIRVVGGYTPPFRDLTPEEESELAEQVAQTEPDIFWVGISTPKQERFMAEHRGLGAGIMIGVGAAFDQHTGRTRDSPQWLKQLGLQWLHRLSQEPRRLWRRYLTNNPMFVWRIFQQSLGIRRYETGILDHPDTGTTPANMTASRHDQQPT